MKGAIEKFTSLQKRFRTALIAGQREPGNPGDTQRQPTGIFEDTDGAVDIFVVRWVPVEPLPERVILKRKKRSKSGSGRTGIPPVLFGCRPHKIQESVYSFVPETLNTAFTMRLSR